MVGRDIMRKINKEQTAKGCRVLELQQVSALGDRGRMTVKNVSLDVCAGEILGIAGVAGNGQKDLAEVIAGLRQIEGGKIIY